MIESHVVNLELSRKLKELGVSQSSYFKWEEREDGYKELFHSKATSCAHKYYSAFLASELLELLPKWLNYQLEFDSIGNFMIHFWVNNNDHAIPLVNKKICNLLAETLLYLIETGLVKAEDLKC